MARCAQWESVSACEFGEVSVNKFRNALSGAHHASRRLDANAIGAREALEVITANHDQAAVFLNGLRSQFAQRGFRHIALIPSKSGRVN